MSDEVPAPTCGVKRGNESCVLPPGHSAILDERHYYLPSGLPLDAGERMIAEAKTLYEKHAPLAEPAKQVTAEQSSHEGA